MMNNWLGLPPVLIPMYTLYVFVCLYNEVTPVNIAAVQLALYLIVVVMTSFEFVCDLSHLFLPFQAESFHLVTSFRQCQVSSRKWILVLSYAKRLECIRILNPIVRTSCQPGVLSTDNKSHLLSLQIWMDPSAAGTAALLSSPCLYCIL